MIGQVYTHKKTKNMITVKQETKLLDKIKTMSELEFSSFLKEISEHIRKNSWEHIIDECFEINDYADELEEAEKSASDMEDENSKLQEKIYYIEGICNDVEDIKEFEDGAFEKLEAAIKAIQKEI